MLSKRLFFLLPDKGEARITIDELQEYLEPVSYRLQAIGEANGKPVPLPDLAASGRNPAAGRLERTLWYGSIAVFALALIALGVSLLSGAWAWSALFAALVVTMQLSGYLFADRAGSAAMDRFRDALNEGDILLVVDVPRSRAREVETFIRGCHPKAESGGSGWYINALSH